MTWFFSLALLLLALACSPSRGPQPVVLLVSWDTTRADALSCYSDQLAPRAPLGAAPIAARTPFADRLAADGVRFAWALAQAPTTLASHTAIMSGLDTHGSAVPRNGYPVPSAITLLAERYAAEGWDRLAVVGASTLDHDMGLSRGFRVYDDDVQSEVRARFEDRADRVTDRALALVDKRQKRPLFLFVHYFDAHSPWDSAPTSLRADFLEDPAGTTSPGPFIEKVRTGTLSRQDADRARAAYLAEVSWVDQQTGRLLAGLRQRHLLDDALIVLVGDHGEALAEPELAPFGHGLDADLPAIHVPLIMSGTGRFTLPAGTLVQPQVRLQDIGATVLAAAGVAGGLGRGQDLAALWQAAAAGLPLPKTPPSFAEATKPGELEPEAGWNDRLFERSVADNGHFLTLSRLLKQGPTSYYLAPGQPQATLDPAEAARLLGLLRGWDAAAPPHRDVEMDAETVRGLKALGYLEK